MRSIAVVVLWIIGCFAISACSSASASRATSSSEAGAESAASSSGSKLKSFSSVITADAVSDTGLFTVHLLDEKLYFEIPDTLLGREMLLVSTISRTPEGLAEALSAGEGAGQQLVRFERLRNRILLRGVSSGYVANDTLPISIAVRNNSFEPVIASLDIAAEGSAPGSVVVEVTGLFTTDEPAISPLSLRRRKQYEVTGFDAKRSFVEYARSYPLNIEIGHTLTWRANAVPDDNGSATLSLQMNQSLVLLPSDPMGRRPADPRVGWFTVSQIDFGADEQKAASREYLQRWRLVPSDSAAFARGELVEPIRPIIFYLDPATPMKWRPYFKQGVEDWNRAFEAAGFKNAIVARDPPTPEQDPDFNPEDVRYSVIRYVTSTMRNAMGPSVIDPRTGEIIESDVIWHHNHMRSYRNRYVIETGGSNPRVTGIDIPDEELGEMLRAVIAHEVGHALGLPHNMGSSSAYPVDSLRSVSFTRRMGLSPSIMDYARLNYIAQPGDGPVRYIRTLGPYDTFAIGWGYRPILDATTPEQQKPVLDRWIEEHAGDPVFRYGPQRGGDAVDPGSQIEDLGDDPVRAGSYAIANLKRVVPRLVAWTTRPGEDYSDLEEIYTELTYQWRMYMIHAVAPIGGVYETIKTAEQPGPVYQVVPRQQQQASMEFLDRQVFTTPEWLLDDDILSRIEHAGSIERMRRLQVGILNDLLDPQRMQRLAEAELIAGEEAYSLLEMLDDLHRIVWRELPAGNPVDAYRRNLQRGYIDRLGWLMSAELTPSTSSFVWNTPVSLAGSDVRAFARGELVRTRAEARMALNRTTERQTRYHLQDVIARVDRILEPKE